MTPAAYERNSGSIELDLFTAQSLRRVYTMEGNYPNLVPIRANTVTSATCTTFGTVRPGTNGNIECTVTVPLGADPDVVAVLVDFVNPGNAQYSEVYHYCDAIIASGLATVNIGQLACSRRDPTNNQASFFITGFRYGAASTLSFTFRARARGATNIAVRTNFQGLNNRRYYTMSSEDVVNADISQVIATGSTIFLFLININY